MLVASAKADVDIEQTAQEVRAEFGSMFTPAGIETLDPERFKAFLAYDGNRHWTYMHRWGGKLTADLSLLRKALLALVDEDEPILSDRIDIARGMVDGLGNATFSIILQLTHPTKYGLYDRVTGLGLERIGKHPKDAVPRFRSLSEGKQYEHINRVLKELSTKYGISLWALDTIWGKAWNPR